MANGGSIKYNIGFNVDKSGLNQLKSSLQEIKNMTAKDFMNITGGNDLTKAKKELDEIHRTLGKVDAAFEAAFNSDLGTLNIAKFNQTLSNSGLTIQKIQADLARTGTAGQNAFRNMTSQILTTNMKLKESHTLIDSMATTMANTIKWGAASSVMNSFTGTVQRAYGYVKSLDSSLNDIRIVTGKSADEMDRFAEKANAAAKNLGQTTTNYTDAALIYYQQGLSDAEVQARAEVTLKAANVTGQSGAEVSEQLTAVWNGYKVTAAEAELYIDKLAAVAAKTASDLEELSTGMSKVASAANLMGVDVDQLNAQLATIVSVTRQAPESVGTALKTIYARMGDIEAGLDSETTLGDYTKKMAAMGVNVLDMNGQLRDMGEVMEEIGGKWTSMSREQQVYLSQVMAGTRQYNNLLSLFDNWDQYTKSLETSANAAGTLQEQQDTYMESTQAHLAQLKASWEDLYDSLLDADTINGVSDALSGVVSLMANFVDSIGGGSGILLTLGSVGMQVFGKHIASGLATTIMNMRTAKENTSQLIAEMEILNQFENANINDTRTQRLIEMKRQQLDLTKMMTSEERNISNEYINQQNELYKEQDIIEENLKLAQERYQVFGGGNLTVGTDKNTGKTTIDNQSDAVNTLQKQGEQQIRNVNEHYKEQIELLNQINQETTQYNKELSLNTGNAADQLIKVNEIWGKNGQAILENIEHIKDERKNIELTLESRNKLKIAIEEYNKVLNGGSFDPKNIRHIEAAIKLENQYAKIKKESGQVHLNLAKTIENANVALDNNKNKVQNLTQTWKNFIDRIDLKNNIMQFTTLIGKVGQVAAGINSLKQIPSIFNNEDLSTGEKFLQIISSLSMGLPMLINGVMGSVTAYKTLSASIKEVLLMSDLRSMSIMKEIGLENARNTLQAKNHILQSVGIALNEAEIKTLTKEDFMRMLLNKKKAGEITLDQASIALKQWKILQNTAETTSLWALVKARLANIAAKMIENPLYLAAAAAAAIVVVGIWNMVKAKDAEENAVKRATEATKLQKEALNQVRTEYDELKKSIEDYKDAQNAIESLTEGTQEWRDAINDANQSVLELMQKYPELASAISNVNGQLILDTESQVYKDFEAKQQEEVNAAQRSLYSAEAFKLSKENTLALDKDLSYFDEKLVNPSQNTYYSDLTKAHATPSTGHTTISDEVLQQVVDAINTKGSGFLKDTASIKSVLGIDDDVLAEAIHKYSDDLIVMADTIKSNTEAIDLYNSQIADSYLQDNEKYANSNIQTALSNAVGKQLADKADALYNEKWKDGRGKSDANIQAEYAKLIGATQTENLKGNKGKYYINGEWKEIDDATARMALAMNEASGSVDEFSDKLYDLAARRSEDDAEVATALLGFFEGGVADLGELSRAQLDELNSLSLTQQDAIELGYEDIKNENGETVTALEQLQNAIEKQTEAELQNRDRAEETALNAALSRDGILKSQYQAFGGSEGLIQDSGVDLSSYEGISPEEIFAQIDFSKMPTQGAADWFKTAVEEGAKKAEIEKELASKIAQINAEAEELGFETEEIDEYADHLQEVADKSELVSDELKENELAAQLVSKAITRMNRGIDSLADGYEDWADVLNNSDKASKEYSDAMGDMKDAMADVLDMEKEWISSDFITSHLDDIKLASEGSAEAIERLKVAAAQDIVMQVTAEMDPNIQADLVNDVAALSAMIPDIEVGATLDDGEFLTKAQQLIQDCGMTVEQANAMFEALGFEPEFVTEEKTVTSRVPVQRTHTDYAITQGSINILGVDVPMPTVDRLTTTSIDGYTDVNETIQVPAIGVGKTPTIKSLTRKSSGSMNNYSSSNKGGGSPGSSKKSGGGGSKSKDPQKMDPLKDERDRYHDINNELKKLNTQLERQDRITSKLTGADRIKALNKQLDILESQKEAQQAKLDLLKDEQSELKNSLQGQGVGFNGDEIADFNGALAAKEAYVNSLIAQYNGMSAEEQEAFKETIEKAKEDYEQFKEDMERYEEIILDEIPETQDAIDEAFDKQIELQIEAMEIEIELKLDLQEAKRQLEEFLSDIFVEDDDYVGKQQHIVNQISTYLEGEKGTVATNQAAWNKALQAYETIKAGGVDDVYGDDAAKAWEDVLKYQDATVDAIKDAKAALEEVEELYLDGIDAANEAFDEHLEKYEDINDELEHYLRVTELLKGEEAYEEQIAYYDQMEKNNIARMEFLRGEVAFWEEQMEKEEEGSEAWKKAQENAIAAQKELNNLVEESIEIAQKKFEATVKSVMKSITDAATDGMGLDYVKEQWELINKKADMYLDKINGAYEIGKLESKMLKALDNTSSVKSRERISELMNDELGKLREKDKLSQYEVDRANALFDLELKKIALEEAQRNKSTMRLRRDSQGNYTYQYTSDNDAIADAQAEVDEAQNALYNLDLDAYKENLDKSLELFDEWQAKRQEIMIKYAGDEEKMKEYLALVDKEYEDMITFNTEQNEIIRKNLQQSTFDSLAEMRDLDVEDFNNMTLEEQEIIMNSMVPFWNTGVQAMTDKFAGKDDSFIEVCEAGFVKLDGATQAYKTSLDAIGDAAGTDLGAISSGQQIILEEILQLQTENGILFDQYDDTLGKLRDNVEITKEWVEKLQEVAREAENAMNKVIALRQQEINNLGGGSSGGGSGSGGSGGGSGSSSGSGGSSSSGSKGGSSSSSNGNTPSPTKSSATKTFKGWGWKNIDSNYAKVYKKWSDGSKTDEQIITHALRQQHGVYKYAIQNLNTGGYTGAWANGDKEGKLALLHQKELVLNAKDTANILDAVNLVRGLEDSLNSRMFNLTNASALDKLYSLLEEKMSKEEATQMEQNIHIEANFPGVSVEKEISDAFDNLITKMSQKMYSTKR